MKAPKALAVVLDGRYLVIEDTRLNKPSGGVCLPRFLLASSPVPPAVPAVSRSLIHSWVLICSTSGRVPNPHLHPGFSSGLPCFVAHLCFPTRALPRSHRPFSVSHLLPVWSQLKTHTCILLQLLGPWAPATAPLGGRRL